MNHPPETQIEPVYRPSTRQVERGARMRRFNILAIYLPIGLALVIAVSITILLLIVALGIGSTEALETISAVADSVMILAIIPTMVLCAIVPTAFFAITFQMRGRGQAPIRSSQWIMWRVQYRLELIADRIVVIMAQIREPFIRIASRYAFISNLIIRLLSIFKRR
jgi:hypothetical protein